MEKNGPGKNYTVDKIFIDSNILVYTVDDGNPNKKERANCITIISEDLNDGQIIRGVKIINPFKQ
jgi:predicted nucleic acid-binding protein